VLVLREELVMRRGSKEWYEVKSQFERDMRATGIVTPDFRMEKDAPPKYIYCNGDVNRAFRAYLVGYAFGKAIGLDENDGT